MMPISDDIELNSSYPRGPDVGIQGRQGLAITLKLPGAAARVHLPLSVSSRMQANFFILAQFVRTDDDAKAEVHQSVFRLAAKPVAGRAFQRMLRRYSRELEQG